ncbi:hypothetical protein [Streptomyces chrestomyceticus]|uniref:hypothetical protein n=1 Tax=Streptomyces chrestomyceticus TaxID=68185 RepID=UPI003409C39D
MTTTTDSAPAPGPVYSPEAYTAIEKAAGSRRSLYAPSVLDHAAEVLTDLWAAGERNDVYPPDWRWAVDLPGGTLDVVAGQYERPRPGKERTDEQVTELCQDLVAALTEIGLSVRPGPRKNMAIVERLPQTPRGGYHGNANLMIGIYSNTGWDISMNADGAPVLSIAAPATTAGAAEVTALVRAVAHGERNPFRR